MNPILFFPRVIIWLGLQLSGQLIPANNLPPAPIAQHQPPAYVPPAHYTHR